MKTESCKNWKIYKDIDDNGISYTVYDQFDRYVGQFLGDDSYLKGYLREGAKIRDGLDNRS
jgi:hypothetical protein